MASAGRSEEDERVGNINAWGTERLNNKTTLIMARGIRNFGGTDRFHTSNKPWLDGYETVRAKH